MNVCAQSAVTTGTTVSQMCIPTWQQFDMYVGHQPHTTLHMHLACGNVFHNNTDAFALTHMVCVIITCPPSWGMSEH